MSKDSSGSGWLAFVIVGWLVYVGFSDIWHSKFRYFVQYGMPTGMNWDEVTKEQIPHDCDWFAAPLGDKFCYYDARVSSVRISKDVNTGKPIYSVDDGKTWNWYDDTAPIKLKPAVYIGWAKVEE